MSLVASIIIGLFLLPMHQGVSGNSPETGKHSSPSIIIAASEPAESADLQASFSDNDPKLQSIDLTNPLPGFSITSGFGNRLHPIKKIEMHHDGVDIAAPEGTNVLAAADGVVAKIMNKGKNGPGKCLIIDHGNQVTTFYSQLRIYHVSVGDPVKMGQVIAEVGSSGYSTGPHLHFELRVKDKAVNPENQIKF